MHQVCYLLISFTTPLHFNQKISINKNWNGGTLTWIAFTSEITPGFAPIFQGWVAATHCISRPKAVIRAPYLEVSYLPIHEWLIFYGKLAGKYTIHGSYGYIMFIVLFCWTRCIFSSMQVNIPVPWIWKNESINYKCTINLHRSVIDRQFPTYIANGNYKSLRGIIAVDWHRVLVHSDVPNSTSNIVDLHGRHLGAKFLGRWRFSETTQLEAILQKDVKRTYIIPHLPLK